MCVGSGVSVCVWYAISVWCAVPHKNRWNHLEVWEDDNPTNTTSKYKLQVSCPASFPKKKGKKQMPW